MSGCIEGLIDNAKTALHLGNTATPTFYTKVLELTDVPLPAGTRPTDDVTRLEDTSKRVVGSGVIDNGKVSIKGLQISASGQQKELYNIWMTGECRPYKIVMSDVAATTILFCATITAWTPTTASGKKNRLDFELTISGDVTYSDSEGPFIPVTP